MTYRQSLASETRVYLMTFQAKTPSENLWHFDGVIYYRLFKDVHQYNARKKEVVYKSWTTLHKTLKW